MRPGRLLLVAGATIGTLFLADEIPKTCAYYFTHACTSMAIPGTASAEDILDVSGEFNEQRWLETGESGVIIANRTGTPIWLYFRMDGSLPDLIQHINPVVLEPGEEWELQLPRVDATELGLLGWKNQNRTFAGTVEAQVLNNYAVYPLVRLEIPSAKLYAFTVEADGPAELDDITSVNDIAAVINARNELSEAYDSLCAAYDTLLERIQELVAGLASGTDEEAANPQPEGDTGEPALDPGADGAGEPGAPAPQPVPEAETPSEPLENDLAGTMPDTGAPADDAGESSGDEPKDQDVDTDTTAE